MSLLLINGSPRGKKGNSRFLLDAFARGIAASDGAWETALVDLVGSEQLDAALFRARAATHTVIAFPLYVDAMPAMVKELFEALPAVAPGENRHLGFIVQSGFPEAVHSFPLERYLEKLSRRLGYAYLGTVIRGGVEAVRIPLPDAPLGTKALCKLGEWTNLGGVGHLTSRRRLRNAFYLLGRRWGEDGTWDEPLVEALSACKQVSGLGFWLYRRLGEACYWDRLLCRHRAYHLRDARPFEE